MRTRHFRAGEESVPALFSRAPPLSAARRSARSSSLRRAARLRTASMSADAVLLAAAKRGDALKARMALDSGANYDRYDGPVRSAAPCCSTACSASDSAASTHECGMVPACSRHLPRPAQDGSTPLTRAAEGGHVSVLQLLLDRGADVNAKSTAAMTALHFAASGGRSECVRALLAGGADKNASNRVSPLLRFSNARCFC